MSELEALLKDYRVAFLRYLPQQAEAALSRGYEIGRAAVAQDLSVLHLAQVHHLVLSEVLTGAHPEELPQVLAAAAQFQMEVLAPYDLARRRRSDRPDASTPPA